MPDKIIIRDLRIEGIVGIHAHEREQTQPIVVNVEMFADVTLAAAHDDIAHAVNYQQVCIQIGDYVREQRALLVEKLAVGLAKLILDNFAVELVRVRVEKPAAIEAAAAVGVEVERTADDFL